MKGLFKELKQWTDYTLESFDEQEHGFIFNEEGYPVDFSEVVYRSRLFPIIYNYLAMVVSITICNVKGHKWIDESYGGPDGGCIDLYCERCGRNHYVRLY